MASPGGYIQAKLETAPNAEGGSNALSSNIFYIPGTTIDMDPKMTPLEHKDELRGGFYASPHTGAADYIPEGSLEGRCYPGTLGQLLFAACGGCVSTQGVAGPTVVDPDSAQIPASAYRHVFSWKTDEIPQTMQLVYAPPSGGFWKAQGVGIDELSFASAEGAQTFSAKLMALIATQIADPSLTPSYETTAAWRAGELALTWLAGSAITEDFDWSIKNGMMTERQFTSGSRYPDAIVYDAALPVVGGSIPKRAFDADDWAALVAGTTFAAKIKYTHSEFATGTYKHQLWVEMPACQYVAGKADPIKNERRNKASFDWEARYDVATSKWCTITLVNATPAYATY
jgi:hypothetical protein